MITVRIYDVVMTLTLPVIKFCVIKELKYLQLLLRAFLW
jgi:hypothetical protein